MIKKVPWILERLHFKQAKSNLDTIKFKECHTLRFLYTLFYSLINYNYENFFYALKIKIGISFIKLGFTNENKYFY